MNQSLKGKEYQQVSFTVDRGRVLQFADAIGEDNPVFRDAEAARAPQLGHVGLVLEIKRCRVQIDRRLGDAIEGIRHEH